MSVVQVELPDSVRSMIDRQIAAGRASNEADFMLEAARLYAEHLEAEVDLIAEAEAGIADIEAGRFTVVATPEDVDALHTRAMARLRERMAAHTT